LQVSVNNTIRVNGIEESFSRGALGELMAVLDSWNLIELSVNQGRAVDRFPVDRPVTVEVTRA
jgi:S-adenosylmethionine hydrolase